MIDDAILTKKREELKLQLEIGNYLTLPDIILEKVGWLISKLTRRTRKPSFWFSGLVLFLFTFLIGIVSSYISTRYHPYQEIIIVNMVIAITAASISMIVGKIFIDRVFNEFRVYIVDSIQSLTDLKNLEKWFDTVCNIRYQFLCAVFYTLFMPTAIAFVFQSYTEIGFIGIGSIISLIIPYFQVGLLAYYIFLYLVLPWRLSRYEYKLYSNDPSHSTVFDHLSSILTYGLFLFSISMAIATISVSYMGRFYSIGITIFSLALLWGPIIAIFIINQSALSKIVKRSKKRKLSEIQERIEKLEEDDDIANKKTIEAINRLMDYHDRIRDTRDSSLNFRSALNFFSSLLLPLISALLSHINEVIGLFK